MANTYCRLYIHIVFSVKDRYCLITEEIRRELQKYISGVVKNKGQKVMAIYCMPDHVHILMGMTTEYSIAEIVKEIKTSSTRWINDKNYFKGKFQWQNGYGSFSYGQSQLKGIINYILNQPSHHKKKTFRDEYLKILERYEVKYDNKYLFKWVE